MGVQTHTDDPTGRNTFRGMSGPLQSIGFWELGKRVSCVKNGGLILTIYTLYDVFLSMQVIFGDRDKAAPHLGGIISKNLHFGA